MEEAGFSFMGPDSRSCESGKLIQGRPPMHLKETP